MKALVFHKPGDVRVDTVTDPQIKDPGDAILRVTATAICGSDLHIYNGLIPQARPLVLGHEFMGIVEEVGRGVTKLKKGDRVIVPFPVACGQCFFCALDLPGHCERSNPELLGLVGSGRLRADDIITHSLPLARAPHGYEVFCKKLEACVKVVLTP